MRSILKKEGFNPRDVTVIPVSALKGDNLDEASSNMGWHRGGTLLDAIEALSPPRLPTDKPLRIPLAEVDHNLNSGYGECADDVFFELFLRSFSPNKAT